jgi:uncharacterized membrane protein
MNIKQILGAFLIIAGTLMLVYKGFTYTTETHDAVIGPLELRVEEKERVEIPVWAGVILIAIGGGVLLVGKKGG